MRVVSVPMKRVPEGATQTEREAMFMEWLALHKAANPSYTSLFDWLWKLFTK